MDFTTFPKCPQNVRVDGSVHTKVRFKYFIRQTTNRYLLYAYNQTIRPKLTTVHVTVKVNGLPTLEQKNQNWESGI